MRRYDYHGKGNLSGGRIQQRRWTLGLSQKNLALKLQLLGLDTYQEAIGRIERGLQMVPDYQLPFFAEALDTTVLWLLDEEE